MDIRKLFAKHDKQAEGTGQPGDIGSDSASETFSEAKNSGPCCDSLVGCVHRCVHRSSFANW